MTWWQILALPRAHWARHRLGILATLAAILLAVVYPSDLPAYRAAPHDPGTPLVRATENGLRHLNTVAAIAVPLVLRDATGLRQLAMATIAGLVATHGPKRLLDGVVVGGTRLGERPYGPLSHHNMPSGHTALASAAMGFLGRRYGWGWLALTLPVTVLTMWARLMENAHTNSAVIAGGLIGLLVTALFVTRRKVSSTGSNTPPTAC
ncbi:MAG: phosphatase PAP2 family protein [Rhodobacter sp.]|uniref:phosphatase PAP2 family protein n=1 Tax=Pararhodobacter sp. TaxID=2127056 RepID=UPI001D3A85A9|nr:phosphatase PAP2 family protein [Pararhodobacter sp.]MCB1346817.1 phosphatase PAP2 family protein [Paracoccaceae bacterium]MCC0073792.1 phosphatase PAP2 family protein [Rhodobacter sp.]HPD91932.1 phosphatase PAP2 family protein [Pararhodobacter sp.]